MFKSVGDWAVRKTYDTNNGSRRVMVEVTGPMDAPLADGSNAPAEDLAAVIGMGQECADRIRTVKYYPTGRLLTRGSRYAPGYDPEADPVAEGRCAEAVFWLDE